MNYAKLKNLVSKKSLGNSDKSQRYSLLSKCLKNIGDFRKLNKKRIAIHSFF